MLPDVIFNRVNGLDRRADRNTQITGMVFYTDSLPSGFTSDQREKQIFSIEQAEALGIVDDHSDETTATGGKVTITAAGAAGTIWTIKIGTVVIGEYTVVTDDDVTDVAVGLCAAINLNSDKHLFSATNDAGAITLVAADGYGYALNATTGAVTGVNSGAGTATIVEFSGGAGSFLAIMHYQISEFFRFRPDGVLWVGIYDEDTFDGTEIETLQNASGGVCRRIGVYAIHETLAASQLTICQAKAAALRLEHKNVQIVFVGDGKALTLATLPNVSTLTAGKVSTNVSEDGNWLTGIYSISQPYNAGATVKWLNRIYKAQGTSTGQPVWDTTYWREIAISLRDGFNKGITQFGAQLGVMALANLNESIGWVENFNLTEGDNLSVAGFVTGELFTAVPKAQLDTLDAYHLVFTRNVQGVTGVFFQNSWTAESVTSDYSTIENNAVMDEAERLVYAAMAPKLNSPLFVNSDGTLSQSTIDVFQDLVETALDSLAITNEISAYKVTIDPTQNVLSSSKVVISFVIIPVGVARQIEINNSFTVKIA